LSEEETVIPACWALGEVGRLDIDTALPALRKVATSPDAETRAAAIHALGPLRSDKVMNDLLVAMKNAELSVRLAAVGSLGQLGADAAAAVPALTQALEGKEPALQQAAAGAMGNFGDAAARGSGAHQGP